MKCYHCETELTWGGDHDIEEEFDHVDAHKMVTISLVQTVQHSIGLHTEVTF